MTKPYKLTTAAQDDLQEIWLYIAQNNPLAADHVEDALYDTFNILAENPHIGHTRPDIKANNIRFWGVYSYQIIYEPKSEPLQILRILSGYRDINNILDEEL